MRSAAFAFGGLQALQQRRGLIHGPDRADFLCAVSGGSYIASAILSAYGGHLNTPTRPWHGRSWDVDSSSATTYGHPRYAAEVAAEQPGSPWNLYHRLRIAKPISAPWRTVAASDFFTGLFETAVAEGELLTAIRIPIHTGWGGHYEKFVRVAQQWSIVAVAATVRLEGAGFVGRGRAVVYFGMRSARAVEASTR